MTGPFTRRQSIGRSGNSGANPMRGRYGKTRRFGTRSLRVALTIAAAVGAPVGCQNRVDTVDVRGVITRDDQPLDSVMVYFIPDPTAEPRAATSWGVTDIDGEYRLEFQGPEGGHGAVSGFHLVTMEDLAAENGRGTQRPPLPRVPKSLKSPATTTIRVRVTDDPQQTFDFDVGRHE